MTEAKSPRADVLAKLLLVQSAACQLPDSTAILGFVCRGLEQVPGVIGVAHESRGELAGPAGDAQRFSIRLGDQTYGQIVVRLQEPEQFAPYAPHVSNLAIVIAVLLEERRQRELSERAQRELESRVDERTRELSEEVRVRRAAESAALEAAEALRESEQKFRALAEHSVDTIMRFDRQHRHLYVSPMVEKVTGQPRELFFGRTHAELGFPAELCALCERAIDQTFETAAVTRVELELPTGVWVDWLLAPEIDAQGKVVAVVTAARDVTARKRGEEEHALLQKQLLHSQKLDAVGQLAGGIAHDFNNILAAMIMQLSILRMRGDVSRTELEQAIEEMLDSANRAVNLTRQLLLFSRHQALKIAPHDLNVIVVQIAKLLDRLLGEQVSLRVEPCAGPAGIEADAGMIEQVVTNLCVNARDAMPKGGRLTLGTRVVALDDEAARRHASARPGQFVCLRVEDTGSGIDPSVVPRIFEPFFTTKSPGKGTGLGLATAHGIVAEHGGWIEVASEVGKGTVVGVYLPHVVSGAVVEAPAPLPSVCGGTERILVVEDEVAVRRVVVRSLSGLGYRVTEAATGKHALEIWERAGGEFDLVLTDMVMPEGISGADLCARLTELAPDLRTIIMTGYSAAAIDQGNAAAKHATFLQKPYDLALLARTIRECLDQRR